MWYRTFHQLSDEDLASVVVYLRNLPAVHDPLPANHMTLSQKLRYNSLRSKTDGHDRFPLLVSVLCVDTPDGWRVAALFPTVASDERGQRPSLVQRLCLNGIVKVVERRRR